MDNFRNIVRVHDAKSTPYPLPDGVVDTCITSPPYWGLRDYGHPGQLGMERTPEEYVANMVLVFREVRRVLKTTGTLWLNLGDTYWGGKGQSGAAWSKRNGGNMNGEAQNWADHGTTRPQDRRHPVIKRKELVGIPWMVAFALRADGWYLRSDVVWNKPNAQPESVKDRPTRSHEYLFLLTKSPRYFYDHVAVREEMAEGSRLRINQRTFDSQTGGAKDYRNTGVNANRSARQALENFAANGDELRNKRSVWTVPTAGYPGAHFAVFPEELIVPCVLAGTSERGNCGRCGAPWVRFASPPGGWRPSCRCGGADRVPALVFDPFGGAGTTAVVAQAHGRAYYIQELNPAYAADIDARLKLEFGMFHHQNTTSK